MSLESLVPVSEEAISSMVLQPKQAIGKNIEIHTAQNGLPQLHGVSIAIVGVSEIRNAWQVPSRWHSIPKIILLLRPAF